MRQMPHAHSRGAGRQGHELGPLLLRLYRLARESDVSAFKAGAFDIIRDHLPFESGLWGAMTVTAPDQTRVHWVHLDHQPMAMIENWQKYSAQDPSHRDTLEVLGRTVTINIRREAARYPPELVAHAHTYDICHALSTTTHDPLLNLRNAVAFYRGWSGKPFSEAERRLTQELVPHLTEAWSLCAIRFVEQAPDSPSRGVRAVIDRAGSIHNAEPGFAELVRVEFPEWTGPVLPRGMTSKVVHTDGEMYRGRALVVVNARDLEDGMRLVSARRLNAGAHLSPRELAVAQEFAAGRTYAEIAERLRVAPKTVRNQLQSVYAKLGVTNKVGLLKRLDD